MTLYHCILTLQDNLFFATREMGTLYETEKYLHNWALSFALFNSHYIPYPYRLEGSAAQTPSYFDADRENNLLHLNRMGIYVFPAQPLSWSYQVNTFKAAQTTYYGKSVQFGADGAKRNYPINYGRAKELTVGSIYRTYILTSDDFKPKIPRWIRLGKWATKVRVDAIALPDYLLRSRSGEYICEHPLNPLDLSNTRLLLYNRIVMPPASLVSRAQLAGNYWETQPNTWQQWQQELPDRRSPIFRKLPEKICLPIEVYYGAGNR